MPQHSSKYHFESSPETRSHKYCPWRKVSMLLVIRIEVSYSLLSHSLLSGPFSSTRLLRKTIRRPFAPFPPFDIISNSSPVTFLALVFWHDSDSRLTDTMEDAEGFHAVPFKLVKNWKSWVFNAAHHPLNPLVIKHFAFQGFLKEVPFDPVKGVFHIGFKDPAFILLGTIILNSFISNKDGI